MKLTLVSLLLILSGCVPVEDPIKPVFPQNFDGTEAPKKTCVPYFASVCFGEGNCYLDYRCE